MAAATITHDEQTGNLWRDVRRDIAKNPSALTGFFLMLLLLLFCTFGKLLWPVDPAALDLTQISQPPHLGLRTLVIYPDDVKPMIPAGNIHALQLAEPAHTEAVKLVWPTNNTASFALYRHTLPPSGLQDFNFQDLGLPLATLHADSASPALAYVDQLLLENRRYFYSVVSMDSDGKSLGTETLIVDAAHATPVENLSLHDDAHPETVYELPAHPFGTDKLGRDLLARLIEGGRTSLFIGFVAPLAVCVVRLAVWRNGGLPRRAHRHRL
jgi:oligopeptide transport system permease protein